MTKKKKIEISIPEPCHEKWSKMTIDGNGRHCSSCNETVIDFSKFTDRELIEYLRKKPVACGNFEAGQLNRVLTIPSENNSSFLQKALFGTALLAGIATHSHEQTVNKQLPFMHTPVPAPPANAKKPVTDNSPRIKGTVVDAKTKVPLSYITVALIEGDTSAETDTTGKFSLYIPDSVKGRKLTIHCEDSYHKKFDIVLQPGDYPKDMVIALKRHHYLHLFRRRYVRGRVRFRDKF